MLQESEEEMSNGMALEDKEGSLELVRSAHAKSAHRTG